MSEFEYIKMLDQIRNERDQRQREELFDFIGENGDDRFVEPLIELLKTDDSPILRSSLYTTFSKIGTELAEEVIQTQIKTKLPKDNGKKISKKSWKEAVDFLKGNLETSFIQKVRGIIETEGRLWSRKNKGEIGVYIRNLLRNNGFDWGEQAMNIYWSWLIEDVLQQQK